MKFNYFPTELVALVFTLGLEDEDGKQKEKSDGGGDEGDDVEEEKEEFHHTDDIDHNSDDKGSEALVFDRLPFQVLVSHVCKHWRQVALHLPALWTRITFSEGPPFEKSQLWLKRSKSAPLDIDIDCTATANADVNLDDDDIDLDDMPSYFSSVDIQTILDHIVPNVYRLRRLRVVVSTIPYMYPILSRLATCTSAPMLEVLELFSKDDIFRLADTRQSFVLFQGDAPVLKVCTLWGVQIPWDIHFLCNLVRLELANHANSVRPSWDEFVHIIDNSPNLQILKIQHSGPGESRNWPLKPLIIPTLEQLHLAHLRLEYASRLMRSLVLPNLTFLILEFDGENFSSFVRQITTQPTPIFLAGLTHLKISKLWCDKKSCDIMYKQLTNLKEISLNCVFLDKFFFGKLMSRIPGSTKENRHQVYCPNLETINVTGVNGSDLRHFVMWRRLCRTPIRKIFARDAPRINQLDKKWLRENVERFEYFSDSSQVQAYEKAGYDDDDDDNYEDDDDSEDDDDMDDGDNSF
jgi:F-box-like